MGLELQILRHLVAHPPLSLTLDESALQCFDFFGPESAERLRQLVADGQALGEFGGFAALAQHLKETGVEYDSLIAEIAAETGVGHRQRQNVAERSCEGYQEKPD